MLGQPVHIVIFTGGGRAVPNPVWPTVACGKIGDGGLCLDHAVMVQQIAQPDTACALGNVAAEHPVKETVAVGAGDFKPVETVNLAKTDIFLNVFDLACDHVKGFVEIERMAWVKIT